MITCPIPPCDYGLVNIKGKSHLLPAINCEKVNKCKGLFYSEACMMEAQLLGVAKPQNTMGCSVPRILLGMWDAGSGLIWNV
jgi:hypothetical protein